MTTGVGSAWPRTSFAPSPITQQEEREHASAEGQMWTSVEIDSDATSGKMPKGIESKRLTYRRPDQGQNA